MPTPVSVIMTLVMAVIVVVMRTVMMVRHVCFRSFQRLVKSQPPNTITPIEPVISNPGGQKEAGCASAARCSRVY
jgi:hypothetical protein